MIDRLTQLKEDLEDAGLCLEWNVRQGDSVQISHFVKNINDIKSEIVDLENVTKEKN
jgi:hypothetical protein